MGPDSDDMPASRRVGDGFVMIGRANAGIKARGGRVPDDS
jgi:hypothetical protein